MILALVFYSAAKLIEGNQHENHRSQHFRRWKALEELGVCVGAGKMRPGTRGGYVTWRSVIIAASLVPANSYFAMQRGLEWSGPPGTISLLYNVVFTILILILLNLIIKRLLPGKASTQAELLAIYVMLSIFLNWCAKSVIMKYGGIKAYRTWRHFFLGLILRDYTTGCILNIIGLFIKERIYVFWH